LVSVAGEVVVLVSVAGEVVFEVVLEMVLEVVLEVDLEVVLEVVLEVLEVLEVTTDPLQVQVVVLEADRMVVGRILLRVDLLFLEVALVDALRIILLVLEVGHLVDVLLLQILLVLEVGHRRQILVGESLRRDKLGMYQLGIVLPIVFL